jgi:hypothetical protein
VTPTITTTKAPLGIHRVAQGDLNPSPSIGKFSATNGLRYTDTQPLERRQRIIREMSEQVTKALPLPRHKPILEGAAR